ncbi:MAG: SDR family NAD(P)-dependent oxidoreductase [Deltaproteobacteria bacterium]|nr:MAG: SDR family NAD(P)-dependent oxidoreductase [Deltaproteobacteria bacterium]
MEKVAVVTGANRGLGREVAKKLAARGYRVVGTVRDVAAGELMRDRYATEGLAFTPLAVDVTAEDAGARLFAAVPDGVDVVVNNAAVLLDGFDVEVVDRTLAVNWYGAVRVAEALLPALRDGGRLVNVSSGMADEAGLEPALRARLQDEALDRRGIDALMAEFRGSVAAGARSGWPRSAYRVSKVAIDAWTRHLARALAGDPRRLRVNAVCPGWVSTDMGGPAAPRSVEQGAASILWATEVPPDGPSGGFFRDGRPAAW